MSSTDPKCDPVGGFVCNAAVKKPKGCSGIVPARNSRILPIARTMFNWNNSCFFDFERVLPVVTVGPNSTVSYTLVRIFKTCVWLKNGCSTWNSLKLVGGQPYRR